MTKAKHNNSFEKYNQSRNEKSLHYLEAMKETMETLVDSGLSTYVISQRLNQVGYRTIRGKLFTSLLVWQLLEKLGLKTVWAPPFPNLMKGDSTGTPGTVTDNE